MLDVDRKRALVDLVHTRFLEQLRKGGPRAPASRDSSSASESNSRAACQYRLRGPVPPGVILDTGRHDSTRPRHPHHLAKPNDGVGHEVHDELRQACVEQAIIKGQLLRGSAPHP
jgi:hypothetical protein